jgi:hypothetical protein
MPEGARRSGMFIAVCSDPDFVWTPRGGELVLVPYMIACDLAASTHVSPNVNFTSQPVFLYHSSSAPNVEGNEQGLHGLLSDVINGSVWVEGHSDTVFVNGIQVVRHGDHCWMNHVPRG